MAKKIQQDSKAIQYTSIGNIVIGSMFLNNRQPEVIVAI